MLFPLIIIGQEKNEVFEKLYQVTTGGTESLHIKKFGKKR